MQGKQTNVDYSYILMLKMQGCLTLSFKFLPSDVSSFGFCFSSLLILNMLRYNVSSFIKNGDILYTSMYVFISDFLSLALNYSYR